MTPGGGGGGGGGGGQGNDFIMMSVDGGPSNTYTEASGLPDIDCDPRVDWSSSQVVLWADFTNAPSVPYDLFLDIMFPVVDTVGTYTVHGDNLQAMYYNGTDYVASPVFANSSGTVTVTRSDTRIEGTYSITPVDQSGVVGPTLSGSFGVDKGFSLSCP